MSAALAEAAAGLAAALPRAEALIAVPDCGGHGGRSRPGSAPPWNPAAAQALLCALEGIMRLEARLRLDVTGHPGRRRPYAQAGAALQAIVALGWAVQDDRPAAAHLSRLARPIELLRPVDTAQRWEKIRQGDHGLPPRCHLCQTTNLRVRMETREVMCTYLPCPGVTDKYGYRSPATARMDYSTTGQARLEWSDGVVQYA